LVNLRKKREGTALFPLYCFKRISISCGEEEGGRRVEDEANDESERSLGKEEGPYHFCSKKSFPLWEKKGRGGEDESEPASN